MSMSGRNVVKDRELRLTYLSNCIVPSNQAYAVHVAKMCQALAEIGVRVTLHCRRADGNSDMVYEHLTDSYGVSETIQIRSFPALRIPLISRLAFGLWGLAKIHQDPFDRVVYGRDFFTMAILSLIMPKQRMFLEVHQPPSNALRQESRIPNSTMVRPITPTSHSTASGRLMPAIR